MILQFNIEQQQLDRIIAVLPSLGFVYDSENTNPLLQQQMQFLIDMTMRNWDSGVFNYERSLAIANEPNDTAAEQAKRYITPVVGILSDNEKDWKAGEVLKIGMVRIYATKNYVVIQDHTAQIGWEPANVPALFVYKPKPSDGQLYPDWVQPTGSQDAYNIGDKVHYVPNNKNYESLINANVWSPEVYPAGWKEIV